MLIKFSCHTIHNDILPMNQYLLQRNLQGKVFIGSGLDLCHYKTETSNLPKLLQFLHQKIVDHIYWLRHFQYS